MVSPESVGMSSERLARIRPAVEKHIGADKIAGAVTLVAATAFVFLATAAVLGLTCPSAEELEDWSVHYHRQRVNEEDKE